MNAEIHTLHHDQIFPSDPADISALMTELGAQPTILSQEDILEILQDTVVVVARVPQENNRIVGIGCIVSMRLPQGFRHLIESFVVKKEYREQGIGTKIIDTLVYEAKKIGGGNINLTCNPSRTHALKLYEKAGFKKIDTAVYRL